MLCPVKFNNQPCIMAVKINYILIDYLLAKKPNRIHF